MIARRAWSVLFAACVLLLSTSAVAGAVGLTPNEQLGKSIFFDESLSVNQNQSCASCHDPEWGWTGPDVGINAAGAVYEGSIPGRFGNRKPPSSAYATFAPVLQYEKGGLFVGGNFWDGRATGDKLGNPAADQAQGPFLNPVEQALPDASVVVYRVATADDYPVSFEDVWGWDPADGAASPGDIDPSDVGTAYDQIALSIAAFEASPESNAFTSKFDAYLAGTADLTKQEKKGFSLFKGKGKCAKCHIAKGGKDGTPPLFTDFTYDNLGLPKNPDNPWYLMSPSFNPDGAAWVDYGLGGFLDTQSDFASYAEDNDGKHKVPTLRNVDLRPSGTDVKAFGHNGYFKSLEEIVHFYNTRDVSGEGWMGDEWPEPEVSANVNTAELGNLKLKPDEEAAIVAFLKTLSDGWTP
jgi:cytochrome c peroxidase